MAALRRDADPLALARTTGIDPWFLDKLANIIAMERRLLREDLAPELAREAKRLGFSDEQIGMLADELPERVRQRRLSWGIRPVYKMVDTCAAEFDAATPYFYSTYEDENEAPPLAGDKALVIGSGPIRIGQGIEFDYCSVHAAWALQDAGYRAIIANSNPETVSTDFDTSDRLYFEPHPRRSCSSAGRRRSTWPGRSTQQRCPSWAPARRRSTWRKTAAGSRRSSAAWASRSRRAPVSPAWTRRCARPR
jgi:carbamoyl-phosphate synthase large subunit